MKTKDLKVKDLETDLNTAEKESRIASYEIKNYYAVGFDQQDYFDIRLPTKYSQSGVDIDSDTTTVTTSADIPDTKISKDGGVAVAYVSTDEGSTWERVPVTDVNPYSADTDPNQVELDTSEVDGTDEEVEIYHLFVPGEIVVGDVPKPTFGQAYWNIQNWPLMEIMNKDPLDKDTLSFIETSQKIPENHMIVLRLNSPEVISWEEEALNKYVKIPVEFYEEDEIPQSKDQLHSQIVDKMTKIP